MLVDNVQIMKTWCHLKEGLIVEVNHINSMQI